MNLFRFALPAALLLVVVGVLLVRQVPAQSATGDDVITDSPSPTLSPTPSPTPTPTPSPTLTPTPTPTPSLTATPTITPTPAPTLTPTATSTPACPAGTIAPTGGCAPCPTFGQFGANDVGALSTCAPILPPTPTPTPWVSPSPCVPAGPTGCDVVPPKAGDANCDFQVDEKDALLVIGDVAGGKPAPCRIYANVKCDDALTVVDALLILQYTAGVTVQIPAWCPPIGTMIFP